MTIISTTVGKNPLEEMEQSSQSTKGFPKCCTWVQSQKQQNDLCFQGKPFNITVTQVQAPITNVEEAEVEWFYEDLQDLLEETK